MRYDTSDDDESRRAYLRKEQKVRLEFQAASYEIWSGLSHFLARRWSDEILARQVASDQVRVLSDLAKLCCLPDGRPLRASDVLDDLHTATREGETTPTELVEQHVIRGLVGKPRSARTPDEITALIEAFLQCYATDYERGELTWVDKLYAMAVSGDPAATWRLEVPPTHAAGEDETVMLRIPVAALKAAGLLTGDQLILEPRLDGLWIGRGPRSST
jgi:hypothetical protein